MTDKIKNTLISPKISDEIKALLSKCVEIILTNVSEAEVNEHLKILINFILHSLECIKKTGIAEVESQLEESDSDQYSEESEGLETSQSNFDEATSLSDSYHFEI